MKGKGQRAFLSLHCYKSILKSSSCYPYIAQAHIAIHASPLSDLP